MLGVYSISTILSMANAYSKPGRTSKIEPLAKIVKLESR